MQYIACLMVCFLKVKEVFQELAGVQNYIHKPQECQAIMTKYTNKRLRENSSFCSRECICIYTYIYFTYIQLLLIILFAFIFDF